jgi:sugar lactone lactonase YvrE
VKATSQILPAAATLLLAVAASAQTVPTIIVQPVSQSAAPGGTITFSVSATGTGPFSYQWQLNGTNLPNGIITTVAGGGNNGLGDGGAATNAELYYPVDVAVDASGDLFIADYDSSRIREVGSNGIITTVAGNGTPGSSGDGGAATNAKLNNPQGAAVDATGNLFIADTGNERIRKVGTNGIITTVAGTGTASYFGDGGAATNAKLNYPWGVAVDASGDLFIADCYNNRIREVGTNGIITTEAGNGTPGSSGDGGAAISAELNNPAGVAVDATGNLFIADYGNSRIREVGTNGIITTVAGTGSGGYSGDGGAAVYAALNSPRGVAVDTSGNVFIGDTGNQRIREVQTNGIITTVAGNGTADYAGDGGAATNAELYHPIGVAVDATGNLFIADEVNSRIREVVIEGPTLVLNDVGFGNAGAYDVVVSSLYGSVTSSVVNLTIGIILSAPQVTAGNTNFTFLLSGLSGSNYVLQVSTDLVNWSSVSTSTLPMGGTMTLSNAISGYNRRFYRAFMQ